MNFCFMAGDGVIELLKRRKAAADRERGSGLKIFPLPCDNIFNFLFCHAISGHEAEIHDALKKDLGKSGFESYMCETGMVLEELSYMLKHTPKFAREQRVRTPLAQFHSRSYKKPSPYGVTLIMSPWNYPFMLTLSPLVDALAAGNTAVVKPSAY